MSTMEKGQFLAEVSTLVSDPERSLEGKNSLVLTLAPWPRSKEPQRGADLGKPFMAPGLIRA